MLQQKKEEEALVIDYMPLGRSLEARKEPIAQVVGTLQFTLLEIATRPELKMEILEKIYIGREKREKVDHIIKRISYNELTNSAQKELEIAIQKIVEERESDFVGFFNRAGPINIRCHSLEMLPGIGKKNLTTLLAEREKTPFKSLEEMHQRIPHVLDPRQIIVQRVIEELKGESKYYLFTKPQMTEEQRFNRR